MKITILQGSARKKGNTAQVLTWVEEELTDLGHDVNSIFLHSKNLKGCMGCAKCKEKPDTIGCVQKDDVPEILEEMIDSQLVIFSSPLYFWGFSAQIKAIIDRTYGLYTKEPEHVSLVDGQKQALIATGAGPYDDNAEAPVRQLWDHFWQISLKSVMISAKIWCSTPKSVGTRIDIYSLTY